VQLASVRSKTDALKRQCRDLEESIARKKREVREVDQHAGDNMHTGIACDVADCVVVW
jgi:hypothetical protein